MLGYEPDDWWAESVIKVYQSLSHRAGQQVFVSKLTENLYFLF